ncbi:hypothetical protein [Haladaptatus sp. DYF46]|uniref:hypothetical protein n=1 Tax=Haladaptatus sp. DYF46 TaxID=2886041 RepID=UPI001E5A3A96|nr:hypothetical protein [Haladaptatus sp. DYF46]
MQADNTNNLAAFNRARFRRFVPVFGLLVLAPWVGEYLLGNIPLSILIALPFLVPLYGGGALLIREISRRTGRGWPTIVLLALAYGVIEAGLVDQSLFNQNFSNVPSAGVTPIPSLGISAYNAMAFIVGHAIWSISLPIAIVEMLSPKRRKTPWLGNVGLALTGLLYLFGCWIIFQDLQVTEGFLASPTQMLGAGIVALALIVTAFVFEKRPKDADGWVPKPWVLGVGTLVWINAFFLRPESWAGVLFGAVLLLAGALVLLRLSRRREWNIHHEFALVAGTLPTYIFAGFLLTFLVRPQDTLAWIGNVLFALVAIGLLVATGYRVRQAKLHRT